MMRTISQMGNPRSIEGALHSLIRVRCLASSHGSTNVGIRASVNRALPVVVAKHSV